MEPDLRRRLFAAALSLLAAGLWASYYGFVLTLAPTVPASGLIVWPFAFGAVGYVGWSLVAGNLRPYAALSGTAGAWARVALLVLMQLTVLAETFLAGAVDTSLLSLVGDVVLTPILVMWLLREGRGRARDAVFIGGVILATAGATLTIVAGGTVRPLTAAAALVAVLVPFVIAFYFLSAAQENRRTPSSAVVGHATIFAAVGSAAIAGLLPGGFGGLLFPSTWAAVLLAVLGLTSFFVAPACYFWAIEQAGIVLPAILMASIPVFTLFVSAALFHAVPPLLGLAGVPLAVVGAVLALQGAHPPWSRQYGTAAGAGK
ncbi:MAG TPA: DMT family transporter [Thermoplasmata archaeon]|nr:DMT family transporter [Thermoplasmata archaeon]